MQGLVVFKGVGHFVFDVNLFESDNKISTIYFKIKGLGSQNEQLNYSPSTKSSSITFTPNRPFHP